MLRISLLLFILILQGCSSFGTSPGAPSQIDIEIRNATRAYMDPDVEETSEAIHNYLLGRLTYDEEDFDAALDHFKKANEIMDIPDPDLNVRIAELHVKSGDLQKALESSSKALASSPDNSYLILLHAGILESLERIDEAADYYRQLIKDRPTVFDSYVLLSTLLWKKGEVDESVVILKEFVKNAPDEPISYYYLARAYELQDNNDLAETAYRKSYEMDPARVEIAMDIVRVLLRQEKIAPAVEVCEEVLERRPKFALARKILGQILIGEQRLDEALGHLRELSHQETDATETRFKIALIQIEKRNFKEAIKDLSLVLAKDPNHIRARYYLGSVYATIGQRKEAVDELFKIEPGDPMFVKARTFAGFILRQDEEYERAEIAIRDALEQEPGSTKIIAYLVMVLRDSDKLDDARDVLEEALDQHPNDERLLFQYGVVLNDLDDQEDALDIMERVIQLNPKNSDALNYISYSLVENEGDLDRAKDLVERALEIRPNDGYYLDTLGWIYFKRGEFNQAVQVLERATNLTGDDPVILEHYADSLVKVGKIVKALDIYRLALKKGNEKEDKTKEEKKSLKRIVEKIEVYEQEIRKVKVNE